MTARSPCSIPRHRRPRSGACRSLSFRNVSARSARILQKYRPPALAEALERLQTRFEPFIPFQLLRVGLDVGGDERVITLGDRAEPLPVEPLCRDIAHITQIPLAQRRYRQQLRPQRLGAI